MSSENHAADPMAELKPVLEVGERVPLTAEAEQNPADAGGNPLLKFDPGVALWTIIVFVILLVLLRRVAWTPILSSIEARERRIREALEKASQAQNESRRIANEQNRILNEARAEAGHIVSQAKNSAEELKRHIEQAAHEEKARILESATREIEAAKRGAMADLKKAAASLSIEVAEKLIRTSLDDASHRQLVDKLIEELPTRA